MPSHTDDHPARGSRVRWPTLGDAGLAFALAVGPMSLSLLVPKGPEFRGVDAFAVALVVASALALAWRRRAPLPVLAITAAVVVVNAVAGYPVAAVQWPVWIALYTCFAWSGWGVRAAALAVTGLGIVGYLQFNRGAVGAAELASISLSVLVATVTGEAVRSRRAYAAAIEARLDSERRERAVLAERAVQDERIRWARDLHDAVGHAVNVMVMQAGVARRLFADNPTFAQEALGHIETVGRQALDELDRLLRSEGGPEDGGTAEDLGALVERVRSTGREVDLHASPVQLRPSASRALYRIVQEAVTNALKHSDGRIRIDVGQAGDRVTVEVYNGGGEANGGERSAAPTPGRGLINMRERARLEGGDFEAGPVVGGFRVRATLPARRRVEEPVAP
ncbi:MAG: histidine kinase [Micromonosporaceae bacterium]|nr:histidine kinase [Micromonosporaceae bacterium]